MELKENNIYLGDCLDLMAYIPDNSIDMILCDLPYVKTICEWDKPINLFSLSQYYNRILKKNGVLALFGIEPFSSNLRLSFDNYKYDWIWIKDKATGYLNAKKQPMRKYENISIFYKNQCVYNPQLIKKDIKNIRKSRKVGHDSNIYNNKANKPIVRKIPDDMGYPNNILYFNSDTSGKKGKSLHPSQKPIALLEYLIKTYTNENELVLDNCIGSGSTCVAAINTNRKYIGIEKDENYFNIANDRIKGVA